MNISELAKIFIVSGLLLTVTGIIMLLLGKIPGIGKLPGDILIKKESFTFYFPLTTCIIISIIVSVLFYLWKNK